MLMSRALVATVGTLLLVGVFAVPQSVRGEVKAWEGTVTIPTYEWKADVNPKFWRWRRGRSAP